MRRWTWRQFRREMQWLRKQQNRPTGFFGMVVDYLAAIRAEIVRGIAKHPEQITAEEHGRIRYVTETLPEEDEAKPAESKGPPPGFWDGFPGEITDEDLAFERKQMAWINRYGARKAAEMAREHKKKRKEAREAEGG